MKNNFFDLLTGRDEKHLTDYHGYKVHTEILEALQKLQALAKDEINCDIQIVSSFRSFERQALIWNAKAHGKKKVFDDNNNLLLKEDFSEEEFIKKIMRFSAIPGASRHHWGTDIDIYDANNISKTDLQLIHSECIGNGPNSKLHTWLDQKIQNKEAFGFFRPYDQDLGGVSVEKWHISYSPISLELQKEYSIETFIENLNQSEIEMLNILMKKPLFYYEKFINNITKPF